MTRIVLIELHDGATTIRHFGDATTHQEVFASVIRNTKPYLIKKVRICHEEILFENHTTLEIAVETAQRLTS